MENVKDGLDSKDILEKTLETGQSVVRAGWGVKEDKLKVATCNSGKFWRSQNKR